MGTWAGARDVGVLRDVEVVVELEVADPEAHEAVDDAVHARDDGRVPVVEIVAAHFLHALRAALEKAEGGNCLAMGLCTPTTSGSIQRPDTMPAARMASRVFSSPAGKRILEGSRSPTVSHQPLSS